MVSIAITLVTLVYQDFIFVFSVTFLLCLGRFTHCGFSLQVLYLYHKEHDMSNKKETSTGFYFNPSTWDITLHKTDGSKKIPLVFMLLLAPMLGATLVLFLPFIGIYLFCKELVTPLFSPRVQDNKPEAIHYRQ